MCCSFRKSSGYCVGTESEGTNSETGTLVREEGAALTPGEKMLAARVYVALVRTGKHGEPGERVE